MYVLQLFQEKDVFESETSSEGKKQHLCFYWLTMLQ